MMSKRSIKSSLLALVALLTYLNSPAQVASKPNLESKGIQDIMKYQLYEPAPESRPRLPQAVLVNVSADYGVTHNFSADEGVDGFSFPTWGAKVGIWTSSYAGVEVGYSSYDDNFGRSLHGNAEWNVMKDQLMNHNLELSYLFHLTNFTNEDFSNKRFYFVGVAGLDLGMGSDVKGVGVHGAFRALYNVKNSPLTFYFEPRIGYSYVAQRDNTSVRKLSSNARFSLGMELSLTGEKGKPNVVHFTSEAISSVARLKYDFSGSVGAEFVMSDSNKIRSASVFSRAAVGLSLSKVSALELGVSKYDWGINSRLHNETNWDDSMGQYLPNYGVDLLYRYDLINAITGRDEYKPFSVDLLAGLDMRWGSKSVAAYGGRISPRLSYNFSNNVAIFMEPRLAVLASDDIEVIDNRRAHLLPSLSFGARFNINRHYNKEDLREAKELKHEKLKRLPQIYYIGSGTVETLLRANVGTVGALNLGLRGGMGIYLSDVSALELKGEYFKLPYVDRLHANPSWNRDYLSQLPDVGATLSYRYNITKAIRNGSNRDGMSMGEISALAGVTVRDGGVGPMSFGNQISARAALNVSRTVSFYTEPKVSMFYGDRLNDLVKSGNVKFMPSVDFGMEVYINRHVQRSRGWGEMLPIYFLASTGFESIASSEYGFTESANLMAGIGLGTYVSNVSAFEARLDFYKFPASDRMHESPSWGSDFNNIPVAGLSLGYRYNITNAIRGNVQSLPRFEVSALVAGDMRLGVRETTVGGSVSLRGSVNATRTVAFYLEPKYSVQGLCGDTRLTGGGSAQHIPSLSLGMEIYMAGRRNISSRVDRISEGSTLYLLGYGGVEMMSNYQKSLKNSMNLMLGGGFGTYVSNSSAIEAHVEYYKIPFSVDCHADPTWESRYYDAQPYGALSLLYRFNVTNALRGQSSELPLAELSLLGGAQCRVASSSANFGYQFSVRGSVNLSNTVSLFLEPKYSVHYGESNRSLTERGTKNQIMPSVNAGMEIYLHRKKRR